MELLGRKLDLTVAFPREIDLDCNDCEEIFQYLKPEFSKVRPTLQDPPSAEQYSAIGKIPVSALTMGISATLFAISYALSNQEGLKNLGTELLTLVKRTKTHKNCSTPVSDSFGCLSTLRSGWERQTRLRAALEWLLYAYAVFSIFTYLVLGSFLRRPCILPSPALHPPSPH